MAVTDDGDIWSWKLEDGADADPVVIDGPLVVIDRDIDDSVFYLATCKRDLYLQVVFMNGVKDDP